MLYGRDKKVCNSFIEKFDQVKAVESPVYPAREFWRQQQRNFLNEDIQGLLNKIASRHQDDDNMQKKFSSLVPFRSSVFSPLSKWIEIGKRSEKDGSMPGNTQGIWLKRSWKQTFCVSQNSRWGAILWERLLQSASRRSPGRQYWGLANIEGSQREKRDRKSPLKPHLSGIMWIDYIPTDLSAFWVAYLVAGRGKGKSYKLFWFQYFHGARLYLWPHVSIHNDTHTESNSYSSGYWHFL